MNEYEFTFQHIAHPVLEAKGLDKSESREIRIEASTRWEAKAKLNRFLEKTYKDYKPWEIIQTEVSAASIPALRRMK